MQPSPAMYSLIVSSDPLAWRDGAGSIESSRFLEHTDPDVANHFRPLDADAKNRLLELPVIFAFETGTGGDARVGRITQLTSQGRRYSFKLTFERDVPPISPDVLGDLADELDISVYNSEMYRTHWAVKAVDLPEVLQRHGLSSLPREAQPSGPLAAVSRIEESVRRVTKPYDDLAASLKRTGVWIGPQMPALDPEPAKAITPEMASSLVRGAPMSSMPAQPQPSVTRERVFIVHGQDKLRRLEVKHLLTKLGLEGVILDEQTGGGDTIIEKFEKQAASVRYAVVLLTPDDRGGIATAAPEAFKPRARQNVILELGYFAAKLGRGHVCALRYGDVEIPSDFNGVEYIKHDEAGAWETRLAKEMRDAGLPVDMNNL